jgi:hypothetical protein
MEMKMAYVSKETKARIEPQIKAILKRFKLKGSLSVDHGSQLVLKIKSGALDFIGNCNETQNAKTHGNNPLWTTAVDNIDINHFHYRTQFTGEVLECVHAIVEAMNDGNHDRSDAQSDYFDVGWYISIRVGSWNRPYELAA